MSEGIGSAMVVAQDAGADAPLIIDAAQHALVDGWVSSMWVGVALAGVALAILVFAGPRAKDRDPLADDELDPQLTSTR